MSTTASGDGTRRRTTATSSTRTTRVPFSAQVTYRAVASAAAGPHWYLDAAPLRLRGALDRLLGGAAPASPSGRPLLRAGERAGFWRVLQAGRATDGHRLLLEAEVRAPGRVTLETVVSPAAPGRDAGAVLTQTVTLAPAGLLGAAYLVADLPAREALLEVVHRRTVAEVRGSVWRDATD
ncbi:DUF2867 domain-containing protein [Nocardioides bruguierae]|uniref:DUF2867 domain-containing protein n=1 Tax=Nocardioides bruguierae TaxID=2945102 RepID=UPI002020934C|nr:DUF2867 domain-containing protein [Nocardioides bruguierae]MCL8023944.1 DUF2867 domain-containing protein [Nocardioides bruguierae]